MKKITDILITALFATVFILVFYTLFSRTRYRLHAYLKEYYNEYITKLSYRNGERLQGESGKFGPKADYFFPANEDDTLVIYKLNKKCGYVNVITEQIEIDSKNHDFDHAWSFDHQSGLAAVISNGKIGFISKNGTFKIPPQYPYKKRRVEDFNIGFKDGYCILPSENRKKFGLINDKNELLLPITYDSIGDLKHGYRIVIKNRKYGLLDSMLTNVLNPVFDEISINKLGIVVLDAAKNTQQLLGLDLKTIISRYVFDDISTTETEDLSLDEESNEEMNQIQSEFSTFTINGNVGIIRNIDGNIMIEATCWDNIEYFGGGIFKAQLDEKYFLINSKGEFIY